jgi:hypothetical protein
MPETAAATSSGGNNLRHIKLSDFSPHAPQLWFAKTECCFAAHNISNEFSRYCLLIGALPHDSLELMADIVGTPPQDEA